MRTIAIINQKGGCGKTTTSINLAACLAKLGQKTLLVDMDPQGHCGIGLAVPEDQIERTIYDTLIDPSDGAVAKVSEIVWQIASDFDLAPSNLKLSAFEQVYSGRPGRESRLALALSTVKSTYDWAILDCPPSVGLLTFNALNAADEVIVPVETGFFCLQGLTKMLETLELLKEQCGKEVQIRVLPTLYDTRTKLAREVLSELRSKFQSHLMSSVVNFNTKLKEAASFGQPITEYDPACKGFKDFQDLARELMGLRPIELEHAASQEITRPMELVQRAKQLAQLTNFQFGKNTVPMSGSTPAKQPVATPAPVSPASPPLSPHKSIPVSSHTSTPTPAPSPATPRTPITAAESNSAPANIQERKQEVMRLVGVGDRVSNPNSIANRNNKNTMLDRKLDEFYGVKQIGEEVIFQAKFNGAKKVMIAGDFNNWTPISTPMQPGNAPGEWKMRLPLGRGRYRYRLVVDGKWITDPNNQFVEVNQFGELNNVVEVA